MAKKKFIELRKKIDASRREKSRDLAELILRRDDLVTSTGYTVDEVRSKLKNGEITETVQICNLLMIDSLVKLYEK
jgi:hypothetical protein